MAEAFRQVGVPRLGVRLLTERDWLAARAGRLAALKDEPDAFLASAPHEETWDDERWRRSFLTGPWAAAVDGDAIVGVARLHHYTAATYIESVWVHRSYRRSGMASQLVRLLLATTARRRRRSVFVWVIHPNPAAIELYQSLGFQRTGERQPLAAMARIEERLRLSD